MSTPLLEFTVHSKPMVDDDAVYRATQCAKEAFIEACSTLYNDILNTADLQEDLCEADLVRRQMDLAAQGAQLSEVAPKLSNMVMHKLSAVNRAMESATLHRRSLTEENMKDSVELAALSRFRKWILTIDEKLAEVEKEKFSYLTMSRYELEKFLEDQQEFQIRLETEGRSLTENVNRCLESVSETGAESGSVPSITQRRLKASVQRWYDLWLRSLSVIGRIENQLGSQEEEEDLDFSDDSREPPLKKRRTAKLSALGSASNDPQESEEDTIPFTEDEYERICDKPDMSVRMIGDAPLLVEDEDVEHQPDVGYSSGENSVSESVHDTNCEKPGMDLSDDERRLRIESSPVKSYYRTVPLDDAGVTDTETSWISAPSFSTRKHKNEFLTDSMVVNREENEEFHSDNNLEDILALMDNGSDAEASGRYFQTQIDFVKQGTKWREISSAQRNKPSSQGSLPFYKQNSRDASSEESEDEVCSGIVSMEASATESQCTSFSSLKRRHKSRNSRLSSSVLRSSLFGPDFECLDASVCSCYSQPQTSSPGDACTSSVAPVPLCFSPLDLNQIQWTRNRHDARRKLRARRLPRSGSENERVNKWMSASTHSAPGAPVFCANSFRDSDGTAPEQSDAPPYEWDDYNPPAKAEDGNGLEKQEDASFALTIDDDYQMYFGEDVRRLIAESRAGLRSATALVKRQPSLQSLEDVRIMANANAQRLSEMIAANPRLRTDNVNDLDDVGRGWSALLATIDSLTTPVSFEISCSDSPLPTILSKVEKFASSLKGLQENSDSPECTRAPLCSVSSIRSLDDVVNTLKVFNEIHDRLVAERGELQSLLCSDTFSGDLLALADDFEPLSAQYEEAIEKVEQLVQQVERVRQNWNDWAETQSNLQNIIIDIERELSHMRKGSNNCNQIASELELCQERMNRLETVCNYLTASLSELPDHASASNAIDFAAELAKYSSAITQLKMKFESLRGSSLSTADKATSVRAGELRRKSLDKVAFAVSPETVQFRRVNWHAVLLLFSAALAFFAWLASANSTYVNNWRNAPGIHLEYVNGPPPV